jgi:hypothetical protein
MWTTQINVIECMISIIVFVADRMYDFNIAIGVFVYY